jgi:hypothetical protein
MIFKIICKLIFAKQIKTILSPKTFAFWGLRQDILENMLKRFPYCSILPLPGPGGEHTAGSDTIFFSNLYERPSRGPMCVKKLEPELRENIIKKSDFLTVFQIFCILSSILSSFLAHQTSMSLLSG